MVFVCYNALMDTLIILSAKYLILLVIFGLGVAWLLTKRQRKLHFIISTILAGVIAFTVARTLSYFIYSDRPFVVEEIKPLIDHAADNGFPSDHALFAGTLTAITFFYNKKVAMVMAVISIIIGTARVLAHVHSPIDIIGAFIVGALGAFAAYYFIEWMFTRRSNASGKAE